MRTVLSFCCLFIQPLLGVNLGSGYNPNIAPEAVKSKHRRLDLSTCNWYPREGSLGSTCGFCPNTPHAVRSAWRRDTVFNDATSQCCEKYHYPNFVVCQLYPRHQIAPICRSHPCWRPSRHWIEPMLQAFFFFLLWVLYELFLSLNSEYPFFPSGQMPGIVRVVAIGKGIVGAILFLASMWWSHLHPSIPFLVVLSSVVDFMSFRHSFNPFIGHAVRELPGVLALVYWTFCLSMMSEYHEYVIINLKFNLLAAMMGAYVLIGVMEMLFCAVKARVGYEGDLSESMQQSFWAVCLFVAFRMSLLLSIACHMVSLHSMRSDPGFDMDERDNERPAMRVWFTWTVISFGIVMAWMTWFRVMVTQGSSKYSAYSNVNQMDDDDVGISSKDIKLHTKSGTGYGTAS